MLILAILGLGMGAGALAQLIVPTHRRVDWGEALIVGLIGSFVGGLLFSLLWGDGLRIRPSGIIGSIIGAIIVQFIWRAIRARQARQAPPAKATTGRTTPKKR
jgi:uncharacterized membrane protein YeaQ/YmgE (transglycosylase-associated protein family)